MASQNRHANISYQHGKHFILYPVDNFDSVWLSGKDAGVLLHYIEPLLSIIYKHKTQD